MSIFKYETVLRPFFEAQFVRLDRLININKKNGAKQDPKSENMQVKAFLVETIGTMLEAVSNRKEEERILRSLLVNYDDYFISNNNSVNQ